MYLQIFCQPHHSHVSTPRGSEAHDYSSNRLTPSIVHNFHSSKCNLHPNITKNTYNETISLKLWLTWTINGFAIHIFKLKNQGRVTYWQDGITTHKHKPFIPLDENAMKHNISQHWSIWAILALELTSNPPHFFGNSRSTWIDIELVLSMLIVNMDGWMRVHSHATIPSHQTETLDTIQKYHPCLSHRSRFISNKYTNMCNQVALLNMSPLLHPCKLPLVKIKPRNLYNFVSSFTPQPRLK